MVSSASGTGVIPAVRSADRRLGHVRGGREFDLESLVDALVDLERFAPRQGKVVELRYFGGLTIEETARALGIASSTAIADWAYAKGWLKLEVSKNL